jgi:hypothetical protein
MVRVLTIDEAPGDVLEDDGQVASQLKSELDLFEDRIAVSAREDDARRLGGGHLCHEHLIDVDGAVSRLNTPFE